MTYWVYLQSKRANCITPWLALISKSFGYERVGPFFKTGFGTMFATIHDGTITWYGNKPAIEATIKQNTEEVIKNPKSIVELKREFLKRSRFFNAFVRKIDQVQVSAISNKDLSKLYKEFCKVYLTTYSYGEPVPFTIKDSILEYLKKSLKGKCNLDEETSLSCLHILTTPKETSFIQRERFELLKIAAEISSHKRLRDALTSHQLQKTPLWSRFASHVKDFGWIPYDYGVMVWTEKHFLAELNRMVSKDPCRELREMRKNSDKLRRQKNTIEKNLNLNRKMKATIESVKICSFLMDHKKEIFTRSHVTFRKVLDEIGLRLDLPWPLVQFMTFNELEDCLEHSGAIDKGILKERLHYCTISFNKEGIDVHTGNEAKEIESREIKNAFPKRRSDLKGIGTFPGIYGGKVRVILDAREIRMVRKGEVLVTVMTSPDFTLGMRIAGAIITDEGGITCHAAIISRELKIPCIVGTKNATKVLKTGDLVEMDTNKGTVRKVGGR